MKKFLAIAAIAASFTACNDKTSETTVVDSTKMMKDTGAMTTPAATMPAASDSTTKMNTTTTTTTTATGDSAKMMSDKKMEVKP